MADIPITIPCSSGPTQSIIVNGVLRHVWELPSPETLVEQVRGYMGEPNQAKEMVLIGTP